jgi:uncharacterized membrane protein
MSNDPLAAPPPRKASVALIVSLCLNVVLIAVIVVAVARVAMMRQMWPEIGNIRQAERHGVVPVQMILNPRAMMHGAPSERDKIRSVILAHRDRVKALREASMAARRDVMKEFTAATFDKAAFEQSLSRMQSADQALETEVMRVMAESAATLTPEERQAVAAEHRPGMFWRFGGGRKGP